MDDRRARRVEWKRGADVWYTARDDEDNPPLKKNDGCRVAPGAVVLMLTTVVGVVLCITDTRRPERVASWYNVCARQEQLYGRTRHASTVVYPAT